VRRALYLTLTANGLVARADEAHPIPPAILSDFVRRVMEAGNVVVGRRAFEQMGAQMAQAGFAPIETVVISRSGVQTPPGVVVAASPAEALAHLEQRGFETALVGGGAELDGSFLSQGLVDEIWLDVEPSIAGGIELATEGFESHLRLAGAGKLGEDVVQAHYLVEDPKR
jgi:dihydrofolate reductase